MSHAFIIGLPLPLRLRVETAAQGQGVFISSILAGVAKEGGLRLLPHSNVAAAKLGEYISALENYQDAKVLVLPYTNIPDDVKDELSALKELSGDATYVFAGKDGWPQYTHKTKLDEAFLNEIFRCIKELFFPGPAAPAVRPSQYFERVAEENGRLIITDNSLANCDEVAPHRYKFMIRAADALSLFLSDSDATGRIEEFVGNKGLIHAQSGGIRTTLRVMREGHCIHSETTQTHLKQGDHTTRPAAARVYYQLFSIENRQHIAILYAGPHPEDDLTRTWNFPTDER